MNNVNNWIEHLQHPLVLAGFGLFVFAVLLKPLFLSNKKLSGAASERLLRRGINFIFILALLAVISGFALSWKATPAALTGGGKKQAVSTTVQPVKQLPRNKQDYGVNVPPTSKEEVVEQKDSAGAEKQSGSGVNITASGQGQVSVGRDLINAGGNVEQNDDQ